MSKSATEGQIGPALDSQVRLRLGIAAPTTADKWLIALDAIGADILAFECRHGPLSRVAPPLLASIATGRLYDMKFRPQA